MSEIDWSKAPEGYDFALSNAAGWSGAPEFRGTVRFAMRDGRGRFTDETGMHPQIGFSAWEVIAERPTAWTGEGLPPVGTVCEAWHNGSAQGVVEVRYAGGCMVLWNVKLKHEQCSVAENYSFRPIRTPEQIAAEEREMAIQELAAELAGHWSTEAVTLQRETAAYLHDIGYRRVEQ